MTTAMKTTTLQARPFNQALRSGAVALCLLAAASATATTSAEEMRRRINATLEQAPVATATPTPTPSAPVDYKVIVRQTQIATEAIWGARVGHPIKSNVLNKTQLGELLTKLMETERAEKSYVDTMATLGFLRIVPEGSDANELLGKLLEGQVGGLYNPDDKSLYVVDTFDPKGFLGGIILSHEITHAIQDANWDLKPYVTEVHQIDQRRARLSAVEGDATVTMIAWGQDNFSPAVLLQLNQALGAQAEDLNAVPQGLVQELLFPYLGGSTFCIAVAAAKGEDWRDFLGANPPDTSEQILHPEKYLAEPREGAVPVSLGKGPSAFPETHRNTMGEWGIRVYLALKEEFPRITILMTDPILVAPVPTEAAAGWGGDEYALISRTADTPPVAMAWRTVWDSEADAKEFANGMRRKLRSEGAVHLSTTTAPAGTLLSWAALSGKQVDIILATDREVGEAARVAYFGSGK